MRPELTSAAARFRRRRDAQRGAVGNVLDQLMAHRKALGEILIGDRDIGDDEITPADSVMSEADRRSLLTRFLGPDGRVMDIDMRPGAYAPIAPVIPIGRGRKR